MDPATVTVLVSAVSAVLLALAGWITARYNTKLNRVEATLGQKNGHGTVTQMSESVLLKLDEAESKLAVANDKIDTVNVEVAGKLDVVQDGVGALLAGQQQMTQRVDALEARQHELIAAANERQARLVKLEERVDSHMSHLAMLDSAIARLRE